MIQTNRVLLIEEIAPNKENIVSAVNYIEQREGLSDEEINEIHKKWGGKMRQIITFTND